MRKKLGKLISLLVGIVALLIFFYSGIHSSTVNAQASFSGNLPAGYTVYSGKFAAGKSCSCATGGISGAPPPPPPCNVEPCFGSSNTRYSWLLTTAEDIDAPFCDEQRQQRLATPPCFQLDGDDAVVISGSMSPLQNLTYYSFTLYQSFTYSNQFPNNYAAIQSSVNQNLNNTNLKMASNGQYVLIVTANTRTLNTIKKALWATGIRERIINSYLIPASITNVGNSTYPDQLSFLLRFTAQSEAEKQQVNTFVKQTLPTTNVTFVKGPRLNGNVTFNDIPKWEDKLRANTIEYSLGFDQQLTALEQSVVRHYTRKGYALKARLTETLVHADPDECRGLPESCAYDSPDALYTSFPCDFSPTPLRTDNCNIQLGTNSNDLLMLLGVNHTLVGDKTLAAYFSEESKGPKGGKDGTFSFIGLSTEGSAKQYLRSRDAANLYAVKITRDCGSELYCAAVPYQGNAPGKTGFYILGRIYLDKISGTAPNPANLVPAVLVWFTKS